MGIYNKLTIISIFITVYLMQFLTYIIFDVLVNLFSIVNI